MLAGVDASAGVSSQGDPRPVLFRITGPAWTAAPSGSGDGRAMQVDVRRLHGGPGAAHGDLSSEKIYARLRTMTCAGPGPDTVIETEVAGFVAGSGKVGVRGPVVSREGALVEKAFLAGLVSGVGEGVSQAFQPQRGRRAGGPGRTGVRVGQATPRIPRVRANLDDGRECLRCATYLGVLKAPGQGVRCGARKCDGVERRVASRKSCRPGAGAHGPFRSRGGVVGALSCGRRAGHERIITFDMGGTSTDVSLCPGAPLHTRELEIGGQPIAIPVIDIHTVGAGGGSLARIDPGGALRVGPESAGADPGPICYGAGGNNVTVTDANVWLGRLPADAFLGGERTLDRSAIEPHLRVIADRLGESLEVAAKGILEVTNTAMERALRVISVERGHDPAEFTLVAFGGAGGLHAAHLAERLGTRRAMVPPRPGLLSAYGMLAADITREVSRTVLISTASTNARENIERAFTELQQAAVTAMSEEGVPEDRLTLGQWVDARYEGQSFELRVSGDEWDTRFHELHERRYGYQRPATPVEAVTLRAIASAPGPRLELERIPREGAAPNLERSPAYIGTEWTEVDRVWRTELGPDQTLDGPALVLEYSSTTWVPRGWGLMVDEWGNLHLSAT